MSSTAASSTARSYLIEPTQPSPLHARLHLKATPRKSASSSPASTSPPTSSPLSSSRSCAPSSSPSTPDHSLLHPPRPGHGHHECEDSDEDEQRFMARAAHAFRNCVSYPLFDYHNLPNWLKDNQFIYGGYRVNIGWRNTTKSLCHAHNETMNVWTHLAGFLFVLLLLIFTLHTTSPRGIDRLNLQFVWNHASGDANAQHLREQIVQCPLPEPFNVSCPNESHFFSSLTPSSSASTSSSSSFSLFSESDSFSKLISTFNSRLPTVQHLTQLLRDKASGILSSSSSPDSARVRAALLAFSDRMEAKLQDAKRGFDESIEASKEQMHKAVEQANELSVALKQFLFASKNGQPIDLLDGAKSLMEEFYHQFQHSLESDFQTNSSVAFFPKVHILPTATSPYSLQWMFNPFNEPSEFYSLQPYLSRWPLVVFMITAMCCLFFSAFYHLYQSVSRHVSRVLQNLDYAGISLLISGSNVPVIYYGFYCVPAVKWVYIAIISVLGAAGFFVSISPKFKPLKYRTLKTIMFISMGVFGVVPLSHLLIHFGQMHFIFYYLLVMGASYIVGAMLYLYHIPERYLPGKFDYLFNSHNLWHILIFIAVLIHYVGVMKLYEWRMARVCVA